MQKYNVKYGRDEITDEEILQFRDFNQVLKKHEIASWQSAFQVKVWKGIGLTTLMVGLGVAYYFYDAKPAPETPSSAVTAPPVVHEAPPIVQKPAENEPIEETPSAHEQTFSTSPNTTNETESTRSVSTIAPATPIEEISSNEVQSEVTLSEAPISYIDAERKEDVFTEAMPIDGYPALYRYFRTNLQYPEQATLDKISGTVIIGFSINKKGKPSNIQVIEGVNKSIDREAIRLIENMPAWVPAMVNDIPITTRLVIPITFELTRLEKKPIH